MANAKVLHPPPPIFHWKLGSRWLPNANEIYKKNVHGQRKTFASPNARETNMLVFFVLGNAKVLSFALGNCVAVEYRLKLNCARVSKIENMGPFSALGE